MIKATGRGGDGTAIVILGLTGENMTRLMADEPIVVNLSDLGIDARVEVVLIGGRDEAALVNQLAPAIGPTATAHVGDGS